jgi:hypothetical protein
MDLAILVWIAGLTLNTLSHDWRAMDNSPLSRLLFFNLLPVTVYFLARSYKTKIADLRIITLVLGGFGIYLALIALAEFSEFYAVIFPRYIVNSEESEFWGRGRGPFLNPVSNGIFLSVCLCCCWMWWPRINRLGKFGLIMVAIIAFPFVSEKNLVLAKKRLSRNEFLKNSSQLTIWSASLPRLP